MESSVKGKAVLVGLAFILFSVIAVGLFQLAVGPQLAVGLLLAYLAGLSMIFLPCTLPLAFVVVPLSMGQGYKKGLLTALSFGLGLSVTLTIYGLVISQVGQLLGLDQFTRVMFLLVGIFAFIFGLSQLRLLNWSLPTLPVSQPAFMQRGGHYLKTFFLGVFLGNAGIGCPNPAFYVLLTYIATTGSLTEGASLGFIHGLGRATPLIFLSILGILGVNAISFVKKGSRLIEKITGWALVFFGVFAANYGLFGMAWWEDSIFHQGWNDFIKSVSPTLAETEGHHVTQGILSDTPILIPWTIMMAVILGTVIWYKLRVREVSNDTNHHH